MTLVHDDWLLTTPLARRLYHAHAAPLPIVDFHNHLDAAALAEDRACADVHAVWVAADPYKHRAMRIAGVPERLITGNAPPREKFDAWAATLPRTVGNPLYAWSALELARYFGVDEPLTPDSADRVWNACNERLAALTARKLLGVSDVRLAVTSDPPDADLTHHRTLASADLATRVVPSLRVKGLDAVDDARLDELHALGCRVADHGVDALRWTGDDAFVEACRGYARRGWTLLLHLGARRDTSDRLRRLAGPAGGYATIGNPLDLDALVELLADLERHDALPKTVIFPLNPNDDEPVANLAGSFTGDGTAGHVQLGPAWWFNDHDAGIARQLDAIAAHGLLDVGVGMTTDSRSLLSLSRHEYFRRVLCRWLGKNVARGSMPDDEQLLGGVVRRVCFENAHSQFSP